MFDIIICDHLDYFLDFASYNWLNWKISFIIWTEWSYHSIYILLHVWIEWKFAFLKVCLYSSRIINYIDYFLLLINCFCCLIPCKYKVYWKNIIHKFGWESIFTQPFYFTNNLLVESWGNLIFSSIMQYFANFKKVWYLNIRYTWFPICKSIQISIDNPFNVIDIVVQDISSRFYLIKRWIVEYDP